MTDNITGKVIVITGASSGMGEATARDLAAKGAKVVLGARRADRLDAIVRDITEAGLAENVRNVVGEIGVPASTMASMVAFAIAQPDDVDVNEILFRPTVQPV